MTKQELDDAFFLKKEWANYMNQQHMNQMEQIQRASKSQEKALKELKKDNIELYNKAIQVHFLVCFEFFEDSKRYINVFSSTMNLYHS